MSTYNEDVLALLKNRTEKYNALEQHSIERDVLLATIADMVLDDGSDRDDNTILRAIRVLINNNKRQMAEIAKLKGECHLLSKTIKYVD